MTAYEIISVFMGILALLIGDIICDNNRDINKGYASQEWNCGWEK